MSSQVNSGLAAENAELRARLAEAEETLKAIRGGEVDALVVGEHVYVLQKADVSSSLLRGEMLAQVSDAVIALSHDERVLYLNPSAEREYGVEAAQVLGQPLATLYEVHWQDSEQEAAARQALLEHGSWRGETLHRKRDGVIIHVESSVSVLRDQEGEEIGQLAVIRDISERKRIEAVLHQSEERLRLALANSAIVLAGMDKALRYTWVHNPHPNFNERDSVGKRDDELLPPESARQFMAVKQRALETGQSQRSEVSVPLADGLHTYDFLVEPTRDAGGNIIGLTSASFDISERKRAEEALKEADKRKDEFLATLAHELRNPLAPIRTSLDIMKLTRDETMLREARETIERQTEQLTHLIDDLLDVSRITQGKIKLNPERLVLSEVVAMAVESANPLVKDRGHTLSVALPQTPVFIEADKTRLPQILLNLLTNATKFTEPGGKIALEADLEGGGVVIRVVDNGIGIPTHMLDKVFDLFTQVERAVSQQQQGLGIGLNLVKRLVELHGGRIEARSGGEGQGSVFSVWLPVVVDHQQTDEVTLSEKASVTSRRVLVVDDYEANLKTLSRMLKLMGHEVSTAANGEEALERLDTFMPEVVLLDINMPGMNGYEVAKRIKETSAYRGMKLIALTGYGAAEDLARAKDAGFDDHLVKPVELARLEARLASRS